MRKIFLLFGATGNLGRSAADYFLKKNYDFYYFFGRKELSNQNENKFEFVKINDLSVENNIEEALSHVRIEKSSAYFLYSTIGGFLGGESVEETDFADWQKMMSVNLNAAFLISKHFAKLVRKTAGGSLCFTSALSSLNPEGGKIAYNLSKNALNYLVESLAFETREIKLSVNAVAPFAIDSASNREWIDDVNRLVTAEQICDAVEALFINYKKVNGNIIRLQ